MMENNEEKVDLTKYPEGLQEFAKKLKLPVPEENVKQRESMVMGLITMLCRQ